MTTTVERITINSIEELTKAMGGLGALRDLWDKTLRECGIIDNTIKYEWDSRDALSPHTVAKLIDNATETGTTLEMKVYEHLLEDASIAEGYIPEEDYIIGKFEKALARIGLETSQDDFPWGDFLEFAKDQGWLEEDPNVPQLLERTNLKCNITLATKEELNFNSVAGDISHAIFGDDDFNIDWKDKARARDFWVNGISWLVKQQGYKMSDLFNDDCNEESQFIYSLRAELDNLTGGCPYLTVLAEINALQLSEILAKDSKNVEFPKDVFLGLYSSCDGSGGPLVIELEQELIVPKELIFDVSIEGAGRLHQWGYSVNETYGLVDSAWKPGVEITDAETISIMDVRMDISLEELEALVDRAKANTEGQDD